MTSRNPLHHAVELRLAGCTLQQIREQTGLGAQIQGWAVARAVDKIACPAPKKT